MWEVGISALIHIDTAFISLVVPITLKIPILSIDNFFPKDAHLACGTRAGPAPRRVGAGGLDICAVAPGVGGVDGALVNVRTPYM